MHKHTLRFVNHKSLKQHYFYIHRDEYEKVLIKNGVRSVAINTLTAQCTGTRGEYNRSKKIMTDYF